MRSLIAFLAIAASPLLGAGAANAQSGSGTSVGGAPAPVPTPGVTVQAPERMVCRSMRRTATRMRSSRVCRSVREWEAARAGRSRDEELADAADTLDVLGADDLSTNCVGDPLNRANDTPLGPR